MTRRAVGLGLACLLLVVGESQVLRHVEAAVLKFLPFKKLASEQQRTGEFDSLVWEANTLAQVSFVSFVNRFPQFSPIIESEMMEVWDFLVTIAMVGVAAQASGKMSEPESLEELKSVLEEKWQGGGANGFDDYYEYTTLRTEKVGASWSGVSAMWVADNLRLHRKANASLKQNASELDFINRVGSFLRISYGSAEFGISHYLGIMALEAEKEMGIDLGFGTKGTKKDSSKKIEILLEIFESYARKTVEIIADHEK